MSEETGELQQHIQVRAYYLWLADGCPAGLEEHYWYRAEALERNGPDPLLRDLRSRLSEGVAHFETFGIEAKPFAAPSGLAWSHEGSHTGFAYIRLANGRADTGSAGRTGGYSLRLPDDVEAAASGRRISVGVVARAHGDGPSKFAIAYSTNEVGNSGWRWLAAGTEWSICRMEYDVPVMRNGNGDFVGLLPDVEGRPAVEIAFLAIHIS